MPDKYKLYYFLLLLIFSPGIGAAQTHTIDSLKSTITYSTNSESRLQAIFGLCEQGYTLHPDTLMKYASDAYRIATQIGAPVDVAEAMYYQSSALTAKGLIDSALGLAEKSLNLLRGRSSYPLLAGNLYNQKGRCYMRKNRYKDAISMGYHVIEVGENSSNALLEVKGKTLIGWAYLEMGQLKEALKWHLKALQTTTDTLLLERYAIIYANLAINYNSLRMRDSAFYFINKAIKFSRKFENLFALSNSLAIQAQIFVRAGQGELAEAPLKEVVQIRKLIGDPFYIVSDMGQLALFYAHYGQPLKGIALCKEGIIMANRYNIETKLFFLYNTLAENYKSLGDEKLYGEILEKIVTLKDSVYRGNSAEALAEMQAKYDLQKKENTIIQQKYDLVTKNSVLYGFLVLVVFGLVIAILLFRNYTRKNLMNLELMRATEKRMAFLAITEAEEKERTRIAKDLHDNMGAYASAIIANVDDMIYHPSIINPDAIQLLKNNASEIMNNLRDTIWALNREKIYLTGISDRFKNYIHKMEQIYSRVNVEIDENIRHDYAFTAVRALNIFRILQEAFLNSLRHSHCTKIKVCIACHEQLNISIEDNGIGIDESTLQKGNGIKIMESRALDSGLRINVKGNNKGTVVELNLFEMAIA